MARIKVSAIAKSGVQSARVIHYQVSDDYKKLVKEADDRIRVDQSNCVKTYKRAASYLAR